MLTLRRSRVLSTEAAAALAAQLLRSSPAIAAGLSTSSAPPTVTLNFVNGQRVPAADGETLDNVNPATGLVRTAGALWFGSATWFARSHRVRSC